MDNGTADGTMLIWSIWMFWDGAMAAVHLAGVGLSMQWLQLIADERGPSHHELPGKTGGLASCKPISTWVGSAHHRGDVHSTISWGNGCEPQSHSSTVQDWCDTPEEKRSSILVGTIILSLLVLWFPVRMYWCLEKGSSSSSVGSSCKGSSGF